MILCDGCYNCKYVYLIEKEAQDAREFFKEYGVSYIFECGAEYNKNFMNFYGCEVIPSEVRCYKLSESKPPTESPL